MRVAVIRFPGSNCDLDVIHALRDVVGIEAELVWHEESLKGFDGVVLPGGFSYGDYLRAGAIAAKSPMAHQVKEMAYKGAPVLGICNGFQILTEMQLLPGALLRNSSLKFVCQWVTLRVETNRSLFTKHIGKDSLLKMPIAHNEGRYYLQEEELRLINERGQVVLRYCGSDGRLTQESNPNGSVQNIAAVCNEEGNVMGLMPHPERACEGMLSPYGTDHGRLILEAFRRAFYG